MTAQHASSIVVNNDSSALSGAIQNTCYIKSIKNIITDASTTNLLFYDTTSKKLVNSTNLNFLNPTSFTAGTATQCSLNYKYKFLKPKTFNFSTAGVHMMDLTSARLGCLISKK